MKKAFGLLAVVAALLALGLTAQPASAVGVIGGVVIDADEAPVAGAMVMVQGVAHRRGQRPFMARAESGEDGTFRFEEVPAGTYVVGAMSRELGGARAEAVLEDGGAVRVRLQLQGHRGGGNGGGDENVQLGSLIGTVHDAEGNAVEGARVMISPARLVERGRGRQARHLTVQTDANGAFSFPEVPAGNWVLMVTKRDVGAARGRVEIAADQQTDAGDFVLQHR